MTKTPTSFYSSLCKRSGINKQLRLCLLTLVYRKFDNLQTRTGNILSKSFIAVGQGSWLRPRVRVVVGMSYI